jgi:hypothetical protein
LANDADVRGIRRASIRRVVPRECSFYWREADSHGDSCQEDAEFAHYNTSIENTNTLAVFNERDRSRNFLERSLYLSVLIVEVRWYLLIEEVTTIYRGVLNTPGKDHYPGLQALRLAR